MNSQRDERELSVLVVDDCEDDFRLMKAMFEADDLRVHAVRVDTPEELIEALNADWDVVLCDDSMPRLDSQQAFQLVSEYRDGTPFVIVSGAIRYEVALQAMRDGVQDFVDKRDLHRLIPVVLREVRGRPLRQQCSSIDRFAENCPMGVIALKGREITFCNAVFAALIDADDPSKLIGRDLDELLLWSDVEGAGDPPPLGSVRHGPMRARARTLRGRTVEFELARSRIADGRTVLFVRERTVANAGSDVRGPVGAEVVADYIRQHCVTDKPKALFYLDIDDLRHLNGVYGYRDGDRLLAAVEDRISGRLNGERPVRLGGDGFLFVQEVPSVESATALAHSHSKALQEPFAIAGRTIHVTVSMGVALSPDHGRSGEELLLQAGLALRAAKKSGRGKVVFCGDPSAHRQQKDVQLLDALTHALEKRQFHLQYQPQVDTATGAVVGFEALVRWCHPQLGLISPADFVPLAEESGQIVAIGRWVLREACRQARRWWDAGLGEVTVGVNLSAHQLFEAELTSEVESALRDAGISPQMLELELTESALVQDPDKVAETMERLRALGVRLAIDDFGTGYSSLGYLKRFPLDTLKVDRIFVRDIEHATRDRVIAAAIINLGRELGLRIIAEGVENTGQLRNVHGLGCHCVQGFLFSRPVDAERTLTILTRGLGESGDDFRPHSTTNRGSQTATNTAGGREPA